MKGGFGIAQVVQDQYASKWGGAGMAGIGYELIQGWNWSFDIEATVTGARYKYQGIDQTWTNWSLVNFRDQLLLAPAGSPAPGGRAILLAGDGVP